MKTGLIVIGVIFLVLGGFMYFIPTQTAQATTTTVGASAADTRTSYASVNVPRPLTYAVLLIGAILLVLGLAIPSPVRNQETAKRSHTVETTEHIERGRGNERKITRDRHEEQINDS